MPDKKGNGILNDTHEILQELKEMKDILKELKLDWEASAMEQAEVNGVIDKINSTTTDGIAIQQSLAKSMERMAETFSRSETRQNTREETYLGKEYGITPKANFLSVLTAALPAWVMCFGLVVYILYQSKYELNASLNSIQLNQQKTQDKIDQNAKAIVSSVTEKVEEVKPVIKENTAKTEENTKSLKENTKAK